MKNIMLVIIFIGLSFSLVSVEVSDIIKNNNIYKQNIINYESLKQNIKTSTIRKFPLKANISADTYGSLDDPDFNYSIGANINYTLLNPDLIKQNKLNEQDLLITELKLNTVYEQINYNLTKLALDCISNRKIYEHTIKSYESIFNYNQKVTDRLNSGDISKSEKLYSDSILLKNEASLLEAESAYQFSLDSLSSELGFEVTEDVLNILVSQISNEEMNITNLNYNKLSILNLEVEKSLIAQKLTKSNSVPIFSLSGSVQYPFDSTSAWQLGLDVAIPIFGFKLDKSVKLEYDYEIEKKKLQYSKLQSDMKNEINLLKDKITSINIGLKIYNEAQKMSELSLDGILIESNAGITTVFNVISANNSLAEIEKHIIEEENKLLYLKFDLIYLTGGLLED